MELFGTVIKNNDNGFASVAIKRATSCGENCASCKACPGENIIIEAYNKINAYEAAKVKIELEENAPLGLAFLVYILPIIMAFTGGIIFYNLFGIIGGIIGAAGFILIWLALLLYTNKKAAQNKRYKGVITEIIE